MSRTATRLLALLGALAMLATVNLGIAGKERIRRDGELVLLELAPVDPRSLLQGDYMALRFALVQALERQTPLRPGDAPGSAPREGATRRAPVELDAQRIARLAPPGAAPALALRYRIRGGRVWLGTNAFFFEEGSAARYAPARYGEFRVDRTSGEAVLVGLRDAALRPL